MWYMTIERHETSPLGNCAIKVLHILELVVLLMIKIWDQKENTLSEKNFQIHPQEKKFCTAKFPPSWEYPLTQFPVINFYKCIQQ